MPDRIRARFLVTALLILLTVAGIRALGPAGDWTQPAGPVVAATLLLEAVMLGLYLTLRRHRPPPAAALAGKLNRMISAALITSMLAVLLGIIVYLHKFGLRPSRGQVGGQVRFSPRAVITPIKHIRVPDHQGLLLDLLIAILLIALIAVLLIAWRRRRVAGFRLIGLPDLEADEAADELARAVESGRLALAELDDARAAIIACYVAMEQSLADAGAERGAAETPDELLARTVAAKLVPQAPASLLTGLFYEARYSTHHMPISKRDQAEAALADIAAGLPAGELA
jgi:hypothetical protein